MTMKSILKPIGFGMFILLIFAHPAAAAYFDRDGVEVDRSQYEKILQVRQQNLDKINAQGYGEAAASLEDPVLLRKKRMEQWKAFQDRRKPPGSRR